MSTTSSDDLERQERLTALFANFVISQTNLALMMLGQVPHPHTGDRFHDLESAQLFIDQLEMIEIRTHDNLTATESRLLGSSLTTLRLAFVEATRNPHPNQPKPATPPAAVTEATTPVGNDNDLKKRFSKKY